MTAHPALPARGVPTAAELLAELRDIIEANARDLGEAPSVGVHHLKDGRVRIYNLDTGWRRKPYREYPTAQAAIAAGRVARDRATQVRALVADGVPPSVAVAQVTAADR